MRKKRIKWLFYAVNGVGLGHITRLLALTLALRRNVPEFVSFEPLFFTNSEAASLLSAYQIPHLTVPSKRLLKESSFSLGDQARLYANTLANVYEQFRPDVIVSDTFPLGAFRDMEFIMRNSKAFHIFIHRSQKRDVYSPFIIDAQLLYDLIIAPHQAESEYIPLPENPPPLIWSDPLFMTTDQNQDETNQFCINLALPPDAQVLLVNLGGGGDDNHHELLKSLFESVNALPDHIYVIWAMGLLSSAKLPFDLLPHHRVINFYPLTALYSLITMAIATAGYNSFHELLYHGIPTIFLPQDRGYDDQFSRVDKAIVSDACLVLNQDFNMNQILTLLNDSTRLKTLSDNARKYVPVNGVDVLAKDIWNKWIKI